MPQFLVPPVGRPTEVSIDDTLFITDNTVIGADQVLFGDALPLREFGSSNHNGSMAVYVDRDIYSRLPPPSLTNYGVIWNYQPSTDPNRPGLADYGVATAGGSVNNFGTIAVENYTGISYVVFASGHSTNSGWLYGNTENGITIGYASEDPFGSLTNSGTIAVHSGTGSATGVVMDNGGVLNNGSTGVIQAAGADAVGVVFNRGAYAGSEATYDPQIVNSGLIEAISTDANYASVGIFVQHLEFEWMEIVNHGTIRADIAILASSTSFSPVQHATDRITNSASGVIEGAIITDLGDDILINDGVIRGTVLMGDGDDLFDNRQGTFEGFADMGLGSDIFRGSSSSDYVRGETGDDLLEGNGGNDLLIGDWGADTLIGGAGNDGLYGESGNDRIVTDGGDVVAGGSGRDRVELGDYTFAYVDGEGGMDTLVLTGTGRLLDLSSAIASGRLAGFEIVELGAADGLVVRASDVAGLSGGGDRLIVNGAAGSALHLVGSWASSGTQVVDGALYDVFLNGGVSVLVSADPAVNIASQPPAAAQGLDAIAAGAAAPAPGVVAGSERYNGDTFANFFVIQSNFEIADDEYWFSEEGNTVISVYSVAMPSLTINGSVVSISGAVPSENNGAIGYVNADLINAGLLDEPGNAGSQAIYLGIAGTVTNNGFVYSETTMTGTSLAFFVGSFGRIENYGEVYSIAADGIAVGISSYDGSLFDLDGAYAIANYGNFYVTSEGNYAIGFWTHNGLSSFNAGHLEVTGATGAWGIVGNAGGVARNDGTIVVTTTADDGAASVAYRLWMFMPQEITNTGTIIADELIENSAGGSYSSEFYLTNTGLIEANVTLWQSSDRIWNSGEIVGNIEFGLGNDRYYNQGGQTTGFIAGGEGVDTAYYQGNFADVRVNEGIQGEFSITGNFGTETLTGFEALAFADLTVLLDTGNGISANPDAVDPDTYMLNIRDFDGNDLGGASSWELIGRADADGDGDEEYFFVNSEIGRFAEVGVGSDGLLHFDNHSWGGDTRVVGIYIDPLVQSGEVEAGGDFDSQRRFQNDLFIDNIGRVLGSDDYDGDGLQEVYFALADGTAYLHAYMHADGNIRYANYQSQQQVVDFLTANGYDAATFADWFASGAEVDQAKQSSLPSLFELGFASGDGHATEYGTNYLSNPDQLEDISALGVFL